MESDVKEMMLILPTVDSVNLFRDNFTKSLQLLLNETNTGLRIRILLPFNKQIQEMTKQMQSNINNIFFHFISEIPTNATKAIFIIADRKTSYIIKLDELYKESKEVLANSTIKYTNQKIVFSHTAAFEILWKQAEIYGELLNTDKVKQDFLKICAHELRTPVQPILGLSSLLSNKITDEEQKEMLDIINRNAKRLKRLSDDLLEITRIESDLLKLSKERFNLNDFLEEILLDYQEKKLKEDIVELEDDANTFTLQLIKDIPSDTIFIIDADKDRLTQVIYNILNNAVSFSNDNPITFSLINNNEKELVVSIRDNGPGIDRKILPKLFTKFAAHSDKGIGLGLYISKSIIEEHGGQIWAENNKEGNGSTFYFTLPVVMQIVRKKVEAKRILLVDDDKGYSSSLKDIIEKNKKYTVDAYDDPSWALQQFVSGLYDYVLLDIEMPAMSGFDLGQNIRKRDDKVKILFMTTGGTNFEPLRELYEISDKDKFIKKTTPEKVLRELDLLL